MKIYLAGPINACNDKEASDWREYLKTKFNPVHLHSYAKLLDQYIFIDPMTRDFRGVEGNHTHGIVEGDLRDIEQSDILVANTWQPSFGTAMEIFHAKRLGKHVIIMHPEGPISPWLSYFSNQIVHTLEKLELAIRNRLVYYS